MEPTPGGKTGVGERDGLVVFLANSDDPQEILDSGLGGSLLHDRRLAFKLFFNAEIGGVAVWLFKPTGQDLFEIIHFLMEGLFEFFEVIFGVDVSGVGQVELALDCSRVIAIGIEVSDHGDSDFVENPLPDGRPDDN